MNKYTYKNYNKACEVVLVVLAKNILEADKIFEEQTKLVPFKTPWVGCDIEFNVTLDIPKQ